MSVTPQARRRQDQYERPLYEQVILGILVAAAIVAGVGTAWWLWRQSGVGVLVRDGSPNWATDGHVIFSSEQGGKSDLYETDRAGGHRIQITNTPGDDGGPAYSFDGRAIVYHSDQDGNFEIYVRQAGTEISRRLTNDPAVDQAPAWSRDGRQIVFMSNRSNKNFDIYRMNADGTNLERLTTGGSNWYPQYSPDGLQLALHRERDLYIMSLGTGALRRLTHDPANGMYPTWAPDGEHIAFMSWRNGRSQIFTARTDGSDPQVVVTMPVGDAVDPRWSSDGKYIAFVHVPKGGVTGPPDATQQRIVLIVELATGQVTRISR